MPCSQNCERSRRCVIATLAGGRRLAALRIRVECRRRRNRRYRLRDSGELPAGRERRPASIVMTMAVSPTRLSIRGIALQNVSVHAYSIDRGNGRAAAVASHARGKLSGHLGRRTPADTFGPVRSEMISVKQRRDGSGGGTGAGDSVGRNAHSIAVDESKRSHSCDVGSDRCPVHLDASREARVHTPAMYLMKAAPGRAFVRGGQHSFTIERAAAPVTTFSMYDKPAC